MNYNNDIQWVLRYLKWIFKLITKVTKSLHYWPFCKQIQPVTRGFPTQRANNVESFSMSWRLHLTSRNKSMMTTSNRNIFRVTGPLCGEFTGPVNSPHKGQWRGALMFSLICVWINGWVNNREAGDLRRQCGHYDVIVMQDMLGGRWTHP